MNPIFYVSAAVLFCLAASLPAMALDVPEKKQTVLGKYLTAKDTYDLVRLERDKVVFIDVRTAGEVTFVGSTDEIDAHVPFVELSNPPVFDGAAGRYQLSPNRNFVEVVKVVMATKGLGKDDKVLLMCRSGDRSKMAVNALAAAGFSNAWSVVDGFEGDTSPEGRRTVNGWKNAGLPWGYKLDGSKVPHAKN